MSSYWFAPVAVLPAVILLQSVGHGSSQQCGTVGRTNQNEISGANIDTNAFYLNVGNRANCDGWITSVNYCLSDVDQTSSADEYLATFAVYRNAGLHTYRSVSSAITVRVTEAHWQSVLGVSNFGSNNFGCSSFTLNQPLPIQTGDALGVCVFQSPESNIHSLNVVGAEGAVNGGNLWVLRIGAFPGGVAPNSCTETTVPEQIDALDITSTRAVYFHANIESTLPTLPTTELTTTPVVETSTSATTPVAETSTSATTPVAETSTSGATSNSESTSVEPTGSTEGSVPTERSISTGDSPTAESTTPQAVHGDNASPDSTGVTIAVVVVIVLFVVIASSIVLVVVIALVMRRKRQIKSYLTSTRSAIDNQLYTVAGDDVLERTGCSQLPQSQEHEYEFDNSVDEIGAYGEMQGEEIVYESPLDAPAISYSKLLEKNKKEDIYVDENPYEVPASRENDIYAQLNAWGVRHMKIHEFEIVGHLGSGQFGSVEQGVWKRQGTRPVDVALKSLTKASEEDKVKFLQEAAIMAQFRHPNVIMLYGVVVGWNPKMIVVELAQKGDLREHLISIRPDPGEMISAGTSESLLNFSQQVALGMQYLSAKRFVHRDLAARNVLLTKNNVCKVADFGLSRDLANENFYVSQGKDKIPVKWTAPEALHYKKYSAASDVWGYGCLLYEIWSIAHKPFDGFSNREAVALVDEGKRLPPPPGCPRTIYELMTVCWHPESSERPSFRDIVLTLVGGVENVLNIPEEDSSTNPLAGVLGAPLEAGENMYSELQRRYILNGR